MPPISTQDPTNSAIGQKVEAEMIRLLYRQAPFGLFSNFALGTILALGTLNAFPARQHIAWVATIIAISLGRLALNLAFARAKPEGQNLKLWRNRFIVGVAIAGTAWGIAGWFYFQGDQIVARLLSIVILVGLNAGGARSLASVPISYRIYVVTTLLPIMVRFWRLPGGDGWALSLVTVTYALFLNNTTRLHYGDLRQLYRLIFENQDLVVNLSEAKERAEAASRAKSHFLAAMSHEIRTPMNGIVGMLQVLRDSPITARQQQQLDIASGSADTLLRLLNDILDFSKIESGKLDFESITFDLRQTIQEVAELMKPSADEKGLDLRVELRSDLPARVIGDAVRLKQVLLNLTGNGIKFTERGHVGIQATVVRQSERDVTLRFAVTDTGIGIDEAAKARLFHLFTQGDSSMTRRFGGTGLGLAISQRLVQRMNGNIEIDSVKGEGSEFRFEITLPIGVALSDDAAVEAASAPRLNGRILVVEDDRVNQRVIALMLEKLGLTSSIVADGAAAVEVATTDSWDAVLMDCQMPVMDGFEATRRIRKNLDGRNLPIIALTANAMSGDREACLEAGMDDFLAKPVRLPELRASLQKWLVSV